MEKRFLVPAISFVAAILFWTILLIIYLSGSHSQEPELWLKATLAGVTGGMVLFSGLRCYKVGGPRMGSVVRAGVLMVLALLTFWKVGPVEAAVLLGFAVLLLLQTLSGNYATCNSKTSGKS